MTMLALPSGKIIDLSTDRAKYHALREPGIIPSSAHSALYTVVDIIIRHKGAKGAVCRGWTEFDYHYSGHTLASVHKAKDWDESDKAELFKWIRQPDQCRIIETARRRLADNQNQLSVKHHSAPQQLFSLLDNRFSNLPQKRATVQQWLATLINMKKSGVREDEIQWSGLRYYLKNLKPDTVISKQQILENLNFNNIRIELNTERIWGKNGGLNFNEVAQHMPHQVVYRAALKLDESCRCILRYQDSCFNYRVGVVKTLRYGHSMALNKYWFALDPYGRAISNKDPSAIKRPLFFKSSAEAKAAADNNAREQLGMRSGVNQHSRFDHITLFGGEDYREWIITLPDYQRSFFGAHFYDHNVLAHVRTTTRTDTNGQHILFIEEVQSDWHQSGKRYGYDTSVYGQVANAPFKKEWTALAAKLILIQASQNGFSGIAWPGGDIQEMRYNRNLHAIKHHYDSEIPKALNRLGKPFSSSVSATCIKTRDPWLNLEKSVNKWRVADGQGKFKTKAKYNNRDEAITVLTRHCRNIDLEVPVFYISPELREQISEKGLPLFGETFD